MATVSKRIRPLPAQKAPGGKPPPQPAPAAQPNQDANLVQQAYGLESAYDQGVYDTQNGYDTSQAQAAAPNAGNLGGTQAGIAQYQQAAQQSYSSLASFFGTGSGPAEQYEPAYAQVQPAQVNAGASAAAASSNPT